MSAGPAPGHGQVGEHLVQPGRGPQLVQLVVDDQGVHGLGDLDERDLAGEHDQRQPPVLSGRDERGGQAAGVLTAQLDREGAHPHRGQLGHVGAEQRFRVRQGYPGGEHQLAAAQQPGRVGELDRVHPADRGVQPAGRRHHLRVPPPHRVEPQHFRHRRHPPPPSAARPPHARLSRRRPLPRHFTRAVRLKRSYRPALRTLRVKRGRGPVPPAYGELVIVSGSGGYP